MPLNFSGIALDKEEAAWKRAAHRVAVEVLAPNAEKVDREAMFPSDNIRALGQAGLMGITIPVEQGGRGGSIKAAALVVEELAQACASTATCYTMHLCTIPMISALAQGAQAQQFLQPLIEGTKLHSFAMSEPGSGNRLWHTDSFAQRDGDDYVIDAFKSFATSTGHADLYVVPTRADQNAGSKDISLFMIDGRDENIKQIGQWDGMGMRGTSSTPVHFNKCRVPASHRLGGATTGFSTLFAFSLPIYQVGLSCIYLGIAQAAFDVAVAHVKKRVHSDTGMALSSVETVQRYIAEMRLRIDHTRTLIHRAAQLSDSALALFKELNEADLLDEVVRNNTNDPFFIEVAQIKLSACETAMDVASKALQVCGGTAYKRGHSVERNYRDARAGSVMALSDDVLKLVVGRQVLGLSQAWD